MRVVKVSLSPPRVCVKEAPEVSVSLAWLDLCEVDPLCEEDPRVFERQGAHCLDPRAWSRSWFCLISCSHTAPRTCSGSQGREFKDETVSAWQLLQGCFPQVSEFVMLPYYGGCYSTGYRKSLVGHFLPAPFSLFSPLIFLAIIFLPWCNCAWEAIPEVTRV